MTPSENGNRLQELYRASKVAISAANPVSGSLIR